jgi:hypothetical protein
LTTLDEREKQTNMQQDTRKRDAKAQEKLEESSELKKNLSN